VRRAVHQDHCCHGANRRRLCPMASRARWRTTSSPPSPFVASTPGATSRIPAPIGTGWWRARVRGYSREPRSCGVARAGHGERAELLVQLGVVAVTGLPNLRLPRVVS
jgi:hypothetical protein